MSSALILLSKRMRCSSQIVVFGAFVLAVTALPGVTDSRQDEPEVTTYSGGIYLTLEPMAVERRYKKRGDVFEVAPDQPLRANLGFVQTFPETKEFRLFLLLNYKQTLFAIGQDTTHAESSLAPLASPIALPDAGQLRSVQDITLSPEQEFYFDLWTEPLADGYYDLAIIVVPDPRRNQRELPYWTTWQASTRASVYVGETAAPPTVDFPLIDTAPAENSGFSELLWFGREPHKAGLRAAEVVEAGELVTLTMNYQPYADTLADDLPQDSPIPVAFVAIIGDRVVPFNGQEVVYGSALPNRLSYFPVTVEAPEVPGTYQLFIQQFPNPYVDAKLAEKTGRELFGQSSQRFILDVE